MAIEPQRQGVAARLVEQDADACFSIWHQTLVCVFHGAASVEHVKLNSRLCRSLLEEARGPVTCISVIERSSPPPADRVRRELAVWSRDVVPRLAAAVMVAEGGGFRSALVRGVGVALTALMPHRVPFTFTTSVDDAVRVLGPYLPTRCGGPAELAAEIARIRAAWRP